MSTPLPPPPRSPFWGACVFATDRGFVVSGVGCMAQGAGALDRALDLRSQTIQEDDEAFWFCRPAYVGKERAKVIGRVAFAKDFTQRDGLSGAAAVVSEERIAEAGYGGLLTTINALHEQFLKLCLDGKSRQVTFGRERDLLGRLPLIDTTEPLTIGEERLLRVKLPPKWDAYAGLSDIFLLIAHPYMREAERRAFLLREKASAQYDTELDSRLLARWLETVLRPPPEWELQLVDTKAELAAERSKVQDLARERDEARERSKKIAAQLEQKQEALQAARENIRALLQHFDEVKARIAANLGLDSFQPPEVGIRVQSAGTPINAPPLSQPYDPDHQANPLYARDENWSPTAGAGLTGLALGLLDGLLKNAIRWVGIPVVVLLFLLLIWSHLRPVVAPDIGKVSPPSGKPAAATGQRR